ncbi:MAG: hypothetical protein JWO69_2027 [Thermoleophilia bacterium]|nr:hypothetical protein [Thermoleophilia bacterium]
MRRTGPTRATRELVLERDGHRCIWCESSCDLQAHHRRPRGAGGSRRTDTNSPANLVTLCAESHREVESNRREALDRGLLLPQSCDTPERAPLVWHGRTVVLLHDGSVQDVTLTWEP